MHGGTTCLGTSSLPAEKEGGSSMPWTQRAAWMGFIPLHMVPLMSSKPVWQWHS